MTDRQNATIIIIIVYISPCCTSFVNFLRLIFLNFALNMSSQNNIFGVDCALPNTQLPTCADIIKAICFQTKNEKINKKEAIDSVTKQVNCLWQRSGISAVSSQRVKDKISVSFEKYRNLIHANSSRSTHNAKVESFKVSLGIYSVNKHFHFVIVVQKNC